MNLLMLVEFGSGVCNDAAVASCPSSSTLGGAACVGVWKGECAGLLSSNDVIEDDWWKYVVILMALFVLFRGRGAWMLTVKAKSVF